MIDGLITVRLEVDYMRQAIIHAFDARQMELKAQLEQELNAALSTFNFAAEVRRQVNQLVPRLVGDAVTQAINESGLTTKVMEAARAALAEASIRHLTQS